MSKERSEAVVLRGVDFSETSRIVTFLTPDRGRLACIAKGVRRKGSALGPVLDTFNRVELVYYWKDGREVQTLGEASLLDGFREIKDNLEKSAFATLPLEIAGNVAHENEPSAELYAALVCGFEALAAWTGDIRAHTCWHVVQLLSVAGFAPQLGACAICGAAVSAASGFSYSGGVACSTCRSDRRLAQRDYEILCALARDRQACPPLEDTGAVFHVLRQYAERQLDAHLRSTNVIEQMFG